MLAIESFDFVVCFYCLIDRYFLEMYCTAVSQFLGLLLWDLFSLFNVYFHFLLKHFLFINGRGQTTSQRCQPPWVSLLLASEETDIMQYLSVFVIRKWNVCIWFGMWMKWSSHDHDNSLLKFYQMGWNMVGLRCCLIM